MKLVISEKNPKSEEVATWKFRVDGDGDILATLNGVNVFYICQDDCSIKTVFLFEEDKELLPRDTAYSEDGEYIRVK